VTVIGCTCAEGSPLPPAVGSRLAGRLFYAVDPNISVVHVVCTMSAPPAVLIAKRPVLVIVLPKVMVTCPDPFVIVVFIIRVAAAVFVA
jgi:hypothetical protein